MLIFGQAWFGNVLMNPAKFIHWCEEQGEKIQDDLWWIIPLGFIVFVAFLAWLNWVGGKFVYDLTH